MAFDVITTEEIEVGEPVTNSLQTKIKDSLDDLDSRVDGLAVGGNLIIFNEMVETDFPQGSMLWSLESEVNFQKIHGDNWVLVNSSAGTYENAAGVTITIPDFTTRFLRFNNDSGIGDLVTDTTSQPSNPFITGPSNPAHTHDVEVYSSGAGAGPQIVLGTGGTGTASTKTTSEGSGHGHTINGGGDGETAPKHIKLNLFMKIDDVREMKFLYKANSNLLLTGAVITQMLYGVSSTVLEVDLLHGTDIGSLTSVFSVKPSVTSDGATDYVSSTNASFSTTSINVGEWLMLSIITTQTNKPRFHISVNAVTTS